jgi:hypothetical protein
MPKKKTYFILTQKCINLSDIGLFLYELQPATFATMFALFRLPKFLPLVNSRIGPKNFGSLQSTAKIAFAKTRLLLL